MRVLVYGMVGTNRGGIETYLLKMNQFMTADTIFDYVIEEQSCLHQDVIKMRGGNIYYITSRTKSAIKNICDNKKLLQALKNTHEAVYFNLSSLSWIEPVKIAVKLGYRVYVHSHNAEFIAANSGFLHRIANAINKERLSKYKLNRLTCSKPARDFMFKTQDKVEMIYNAIQPEQFIFNKEIRNRIRNERGIQESDKVIGFVGRLNDQKNPLFLPEIMKKIVEKRSNVKMWIIGDGPMRDMLSNKISKLSLASSVQMLGNVKNVNEYMQGMDMIILPSFHEGLPYVIVEAQTSGLRCVVSEYVTKEVDATGNVAFLPLLESADNWAEYICSELDNSQTSREKWGAYMSTTNFNIENEALRLEKILSE